MVEFEILLCRCVELGILFAEVGLLRACLGVGYVVSCVYVGVCFRIVELEDSGVCIVGWIA